GAFIRGSLLVEPDTSPGEPSARGRIASLARGLEQGGSASMDHAAVVPALIEGLAHPDPYVRARSAEVLASLLPDGLGVSDAIPALEGLLADEAIAEVGVSGPFWGEGRLYHWHRRRWSPRGWAIRALFWIGRVPKGGAMLGAMVA